eukprot:324306-Chlamydomonas_euryale.AAC.1
MARLGTFRQALESIITCRVNSAMTGVGDTSLQCFRSSQLCSAAMPRHHHCLLFYHATSDMMCNLIPCVARVELAAGLRPIHYVLFALFVKLGGWRDAWK